MSTSRYREIFFAAHGFGPYTCFFCQQPVEFDEAVVHHEDEVRTNNAIENLRPAHGPCHNDHHRRKSPSAETRRKISLALRGRKFTPEHLDALRAAAKTRRPRETSRG